MALTEADIDLQKRLLDSSSVLKGGSIITARTYLDLSPEQILIDAVSLRIRAQLVGVPSEIPSLPPTWRKRLAHVTT